MLVELKPNIYALEVPENSYRHEFIHVFAGEDVIRWYKNPEPPKGEIDTIDDVFNDGFIVDEWDAVNIEFSNVEALFPTLNCTEQQAVTVVDNHWDTEWEQTTYGSLRDGTMVYDNAVDALQSLLRSKGLNPELNYLLIKRITE